MSDAIDGKSPIFVATTGYFKVGYWTERWKIIPMNTRGNLKLCFLSRMDHSLKAINKQSG